MIKKVKVSEPELITDPDEIRYLNEIMPLKCEISELEQKNQILKEKYKILDEINQQLKEEINKISKKELKIMQMLRSIELCTLTKERIDQIEEVMFDLGDKNE